MLDCLLVRAHRQAATERGGQNQALVRSRGGSTAKIHMAVDGNGRPIELILARGHRGDVTLSSALLEGLSA